jgi:outer membrane protein TolC
VNSAFAVADRAFAQLGVSDAGLMPKVDLVGHVNKEFNKNSTYSKDEWYLGLKFSWTLSLGGEEMHRSRASLSSHDAAFQQALATQNNFKQQVRTSWNQVENGQERLDLLADAVEISKSVMEVRKRLRDAGKETALAALDAEVEYYGVLANKVNAEFDSRIAAYRLLAALGALSPENLGLYSGQFAIPVYPLVTKAEQI